MNIFSGANLVTEINIEFRPELSNGILLISGERDDFNGDFMLVSLNNGFIEFIFDCGSGKGVIRSSEKVVLHQWNTIVIYRYRWDAWLELNEKRRNRGRSLGIFSRITFRMLLGLIFFFKIIIQLNMFQELPFSSAAKEIYHPKLF